MDEDGNSNVMLLVALVLLGVYSARRRPVAQQNSILTGVLYFIEIMAAVNVSRFLQLARIDNATFVMLKEMLMNVGGLQDTMYICAGQKLMILLYIVRGHTNRETAERWQYSRATISAIVHMEVLISNLQFWSKYRWDLCAVECSNTFAEKRSELCKVSYLCQYRIAFLSSMHRLHAMLLLWSS